MVRMDLRTVRQAQDVPTVMAFFRTSFVGLLIVLPLLNIAVVRKTVRQLEQKFFWPFNNNMTVLNGLFQ